VLLAELSGPGVVVAGALRELSIPGRGAAGPVCSIALGAPGEPRLFFAMRDQDLRLASGMACELRSAGQPSLPLAVRDVLPATDLLLARAASERMELLRFLVDICAQRLRLSRNAEFGLICLALARACVPPAGRRLRALTHQRGALALWGVNGDASATIPWHLVGRHGIRRVAPPVDGIVVLEAALAADAVLIPPGKAQPLTVSASVPGEDAGAAAEPLPGLSELLRRAARAAPEGGGVLPRRALAAVAMRAGLGDRRCASLLREAQMLSAAAPRALEDPAYPVSGALELALSDQQGGVFLAGWLRDPLRIVAGLELRSPWDRSVIDPAALSRFARPDLAGRFAQAPHGGAGPNPGFLVHFPEVPAAGAVAQWRMGLRLASGETLELVAPPGILPPTAARDLVLGCVRADLLPHGALQGAIVPAVARLQAAVLACAQGAPYVVAFGAAVARPIASIVMPLYRNLHFLRFQIAAFARDQEARRCELIYVLDSPEQQAEVEHLLRGLAALHGLPITLVVHPENRGYARACNSGAAIARAPVLAMLNSDVIPAEAGWLGPLLARLARDRRLVAVGPKLLFADHSVQHAGLFFARSSASGPEWYNDHYCKGFPRHHPGVSAGRRVPGVTGAALVVWRSAFEAIGGFNVDYVIGDYEDSDLCLRLREAGGEIGYEPAAELFHFERQSIVSHAAHAGTLASAYNRHLHDTRWSDRIDALMACFLPVTRRRSGSHREPLGWRAAPGPAKAAVTVLALP